ncbi:hypothetical protein M1116_00655 [Patescibacteria group bacterium]|nr:hypothetical protein [Patescibacteria group bacterium]
MDITSPIFVAFALISISFFYLTPAKFRLLLLIFISFIFIATFDASLPLFLIIYTLINYFFGLILSRLTSRTIRQIFLAISIIFDLLLLSYFKYLLFLFTNLTPLFPSLHLQVPDTYPIIASIGVSFFTFKTISFLFDIFRNPTTIKSYFYFLSYIIFFPEFLSGPISRFSNFYSSSIQPNSFSNDKFFSGTYRLTIGIFKKVVIANNIATIISPVYSNIYHFRGIDLLISTYLFSFQLYFDFSGYSDMAVGLGKILGIPVPENFNNPYLSSSIKEFWQRWHISLSSWFREYLYIPLGGNRKGFLRQMINILIVFLATGIWHGSSWNFVVWGFLHGIYQIITAVYTKFFTSIFTLNQKAKKLIGIFLTFNFVNFAWVFFKTKSLPEAFYILTHLFSSAPIHLNFQVLLFPLAISLLVLPFFYFSKRSPHPVPLYISVNFLLLFGILFFASRQVVDFLYFKF